MTGKRQRGYMAKFPLLTEVEAGRPVRYWVPECDSCSYPTKIRHTGKNLPEEALRQILRKRGWFVGQRLECPLCHDGRKTVIAPAMQEEQSTMAAEEPRAPTPEERRRVRDALDEHYLEDKGCYRQNFSDKSVAAKLNVPVKWVADLREANGFGPDTNEAASVRAAEVRELEQELAKVQDELISRFDELQKRLNKIKVDQSYAA